ncbi:uncharacterized protein LOC124358790 [Homalodisca vitripennis]|uniref:uncharacterized protein LOC124358790 n=1 Tax=Homalodisca vitripennis TaxID=197043 RepID=UPI001EEC156F|nr:uncharacterized protein LOC124358790 [Homalodisca vitripennis]
MDEEPSNSRGKKFKYESSWKRNKIKHATVKGNEYVDYKNRVVPAVTSGPHCGCKQECTQRLAESEGEIFVRLRSFDTKNEQDVFLQSLITSQNVKKKTQAQKTSSKCKDVS